MSNGKGKQPQCEPVYIAAGCNRYSNVADVRERDGLVVYGAGNFVALWNSEDPTHCGVHQTLPGHAGQVTSVKFLRSDDSSMNCAGIVSGDSSGKLSIWIEDVDRGFIHATSVTLAGSISAIASIETDTGCFIIAVGTSHSELHVFAYAFNGGLERLEHDLPVGSKIPLSVALARMPRQSLIMLAVGTTEGKIHILTQDYQVGQSTSKNGSRTGLQSGSFKYRQSLTGHADWVRSLSFTAPLDLSASATLASDYESGDVLLASGSQDTYTRTWRVTAEPVKQDRASGSGALQSLDLLMESEIDAKRYSFVHRNVEVSIHAESVLLGHENWVTDVNWRAPEGEVPQLLTASADRSMMLWNLDPTTKIWLSTNRFGEIGGTNLGFFGALWGHQARTILAHGWGGSFHVWHQEDDGLWKSRLSISGHNNKVTSLAWEPEGKYLISVSTDQTARLHGCWRRSGAATWHELARPQIHGYDMEDIAFLSRLRYISGSEEKIVRVFDAPAKFIESMRTLGVDENLADDGERPNAAAVPALGLSNKAVFEANDQIDQSQASADAKNIPPLEEQLLTSTLWPETEKLYGHGYEINAIAASHDGRFIASACRSTTPEHAVVRLHRTSNWSQVLPPLAGHSLSVTSIRFSPDDRYILTASRDRSWQLYERAEDGESYARAASGAKAHARIIWDCAWAQDGNFFATAARDKQVKIWQSVEGSSQNWKVVATLALPDAATAVDLTHSNDMHIIAIGTEAGHIYIYSSGPSIAEWKLAYQADSRIAHCSTVHAVSWQPRTSSSAPELLLASGSDDKSLRVLQGPETSSGGKGKAIAQGLESRLTMKRVYSACHIISRFRDDATRFEASA